ncbi:hypothetical protein TNCV_1944601 [Trichonephila clavipes]|nr:hypothetical protein TNCV_1944601 [Trichonephila clavipes]
MGNPVVVFCWNNCNDKRRITGKRYIADHRKCNTKNDKRYNNKIYFVDNMLIKYQMIKFIDFCEVWFLPELVARVVAIVGDHRSTQQVSALIQRDFGCVLGVQQTKRLKKVAKVDLVLKLGRVIWFND